MPLHRASNLYDVLQLDSAASAAEIRSAYRRAALLSHPDKGGTADSFKKVSFAFDVLSNVASRAQYDQWSKSQAVKATKPKARQAEGKCFTVRVRKAFEQLRNALQSASKDQRRVAIGATKESMRVLFLQYLSHFREREAGSRCAFKVCHEKQPQAARRKKATAPRKATESRGSRCPPSWKGHEEDLVYGQAHVLAPLLHQGSGEYRCCH